MPRRYPGGHPGGADASEERRVAAITKATRARQLRDLDTQYVQTRDGLVASMDQLGERIHELDQQYADSVESSPPPPVP